MPLMLSNGCSLAATALPNRARPDITTITLLALQAGQLYAESIAPEAGRNELPLHSRQPLLTKR
jgi:hypothetical protein